MYLQVTQSNAESPLVDTNKFNSSFGFSFIQAFFLIFFTCLTSQTFILFLILQKRTPKMTLCLLSGLAIILSNLFSTLAGMTIDLLLYNHYCVLFACFVLFVLGGRSLFNGILLDSKTFKEKIDNIIKADQSSEPTKKVSKLNLSMLEPSKNNINNAKTLSVIDECNTEEERSELLEPLLHKSRFSKSPRKIGTKTTSRSNASGKPEEVQVKSGFSQSQNTLLDTSCEDSTAKQGIIHLQEVNDLINEQEEEDYSIELFSERSSYFTKVHYWDILKSIFLCECLNKTELGIVALATVYHPVGIFIGSFVAFMTCLFVCLSYNEIIKKLTEKSFNLLSGFIFFVYIFQIYFINE